MTLSRRAVLGTLVVTGLGAGGAGHGLARTASYPAPTREAMLTVPGGRVYVRVNGDLKGSRPPLVIVHGGPGGTHNSYLPALALADTRAVILYDQLDSGRSDWPQDPANWTVTRFVDELEAVRIGLGVRRWHVCGHSWGGTIALEYGARHMRAAADPLAGLVLASPLISTRRWIADADALRATLPPATRGVLAACETSAPPASAACDAATAQFYARFNRREAASPAMAAGARERPGRGFDARLYATMWGRSEFSATGSLREYDGEPLLGRLDGARTLFLVGQYDEARPATAALFAERVPGADYGVVPGAAHSLFADRPAETLAMLRGFLARHDPAATR
ncbi:proline iminopeptidase-family hydrolase [Sphingomonas abaci]|uniref:Proline iminopeptidase/L-proline amide hydrolase n=1 Tax=Sphingomonas abaci TaxID=237611 RepID=A0A7W7EZ51_9SPHN|nr:proline iminopeptidase-family hydrolase [Sphingomonas abaci]MBB4619367.1 proline iminopeptidase/L-proline amide hydrolase [Sphingomonas abaci]